MLAFILFADPLFISELAVVWVLENRERKGIRTRDREEAENEPDQKQLRDFSKWIYRPIIRVFHLSVRQAIEP